LRKKNNRVFSDIEATVQIYEPFLEDVQQAAELSESLEGFEEEM
jgi:hypothetical protein